MIFAVVGMVSDAVCDDRKIADEYAVKGVYLLNFAKFTEWPLGVPRRAEGVFRICSWKESPFTQLEAVVSRKQVGTLRVSLEKISSVLEIPRCDILFIQSAFAADTPKLRSPVEDAHTVLVTETDPKGMLHFLVNSEGEIGFECDLLSAQRGKIKFSSQLISLAESVEGDITP